jgi:hypothetical protein
MARPNEFRLFNSGDALANLLLLLLSGSRGNVLRTAENIFNIYPTRQQRESTLSISEVQVLEVVEMGKRASSVTWRQTGH